MCKHLWNILPGPIANTVQLSHSLNYYQRKQMQSTQPVSARTTRSYLLLISLEHKTSTDINKRDSAVLSHPETNKRDAAVLSHSDTAGMTTVT